MENLDTGKVWNDVLDGIRVSVSSANFTTWFKQTHLSKLEKTNNRYVAEVGCKSSFIKTTIESRYFGLIQDSLNKSLNTTCDLYFVVKDNQSSELLPTPLFEPSNKNFEELGEIIMKTGLRPGFTFENFAVSSSNQMAWAAAEAVSRELGSAYNPLFIWGGVGVGKTHLMNAVGHYAIEKNITDKIVCCTGEQFTNDIVEGIRNKTTQGVRNKYRKAKILLVDDIQFIAGKDAIQEEFFHTFNSLVNSGSQVLLTSDRPPSEISKLEERLKSRFEAGLIVDISLPDFELRCAITQIKSQERKLNIPMDLIQLIAGNIEAARKIEGFLIRLSTEIKVKNNEITPELIESLLGKRDENSSMSSKTSPNDIINAASKYFSVGKRALLGTSRARPISLPRQILMYFLRTQANLPLEEIGRLIGGRDHTTVIHAVQKITTLASSNVQIREDIRGIKGLL